jgi:N utilization substance protein A
VAVHSRLPSIDPIGACVGMRGSRIQNIVNELGGERIDVIKWDPDPANFVSNALSPAQVLEVEVFPDDRRASVVVPDKMLSLAIGKEGQNARLAAKLTGWRIDIHSQSSTAEGVEEEPSTFVPFQEGEEPDIDIIEEAEEVAAAAAAAPLIEQEAPRLQPAALRPAEDGEAAPEEDVSFRDALERMAVPDREERESEDYGEEEDEDEEYEVPTAVMPESRPTAIRFAEDVLPQRPDETEDASKKPAAKKAKRAPRFAEEEDDMDDIEYSGRIH